MAEYQTFATFKVRQSILVNGMSLQDDICYLLDDICHISWCGMQMLIFRSCENYPHSERRRSHLWNNSPKISSFAMKERIGIYEREYRKETNFRASTHCRTDPGGQRRRCFTSGSDPAPRKSTGKTIRLRIPHCPAAYRASRPASPE